jgi:hypothetical protein
MPPGEDAGRAPSAITPSMRAGAFSATVIRIRRREPFPRSTTSGNSPTRAAGRGRTGARSRSRWAPRGPRPPSPHRSPGQSGGSGGPPHPATLLAVLRGPTGWDLMSKARTGGPSVVPRSGAFGRRQRLGVSMRAVRSECGCPNRLVPLMERSLRGRSYRRRRWSASWIGAGGRRLPGYYEAKRRFDFPTYRRGRDLWAVWRTESMAECG